MPKQSSLFEHRMYRLSQNGPAEPSPAQHGRLIAAGCDEPVKPVAWPATEADPSSTSSSTRQSRRSGRKLSRRWRGSSELVLDVDPSVTSLAGLVTAMINIFTGNRDYGCHHTGVMEAYVIHTHTVCVLHTFSITLCMARTVLRFNASLNLIMQTKRRSQTASGRTMAVGLSPRPNKGRT